MKFFASYSFTIVNVGLEISFSNPKCLRIPSVNFVFPEPKSPERTIIEWPFNFAANSSANLIVSSSECETKL